MDRKSKGKLLILLGLVGVTSACEGFFHHSNQMNNPNNNKPSSQVYQQSLFHYCCAMGYFVLELVSCGVGRLGLSMKENESDSNIGSENIYYHISL